MTLFICITSRLYSSTRNSFKKKLTPTLLLAEMAAQTDVQERCVVILGKTGTGKSTIANMLVGHDPMSQEDPPFALSENPFASPIGIVRGKKSEFRQGNTVYRMRVVDTPGLFNTFGKTEGDTFKELEEYFHDHFIVGANLILITLTKGVFTQEEKYTLSAITGRFTGICNISALVITKCEKEQTVQSRKMLCQSFKNDDNTKEIAGQMKMGIYTVGFPPVAQMKEPLSSLEDLKKAMKDDTQRLIDLIVKCEKVHLTKTLFQPSSCTIQ